MDLGPCRVEIEKETHNIGRHKCTSFNNNSDRVEWKADPKDCLGRFLFLPEVDERTRLCAPTLNVVRWKMPREAKIKYLLRLRCVWLSSVSWTTEIGVLVCTHLSLFFSSLVKTLSFVDTITGQEGREFPFRANKYVHKQKDTGGDSGSDRYSNISLASPHCSCRFESAAPPPLNHSGCCCLTAISELVPVSTRWTK